MKRRDTIIISAQDFYNEPCLNPNTFFKKKDRDEIFFNWSAPVTDLNKGFIYQLKCQPGLILVISRQYPSTAFSIYYEEETTCVRLFFILGERSLVVHHSQKQVATFYPNQGYLIYARQYKRELLHLPAKPFCVVGIFMEPWFIKRFSQGIAGEFARKIETILAIQKQGGIFRCPVFMTPSINVCIHEILGCTYIDARRHLFSRYYAFSKSSLGKSGSFGAVDED